MGSRFAYLATISDLPLADPQVDSQTGTVVFKQPISQSFRRRAFILSLIMIVLSAAVVYFVFPLAAGIQPNPTSTRGGRLVLVFYVSLLSIPYWIWWIFRLKTNRNYVRRIEVHKSGICFLNEKRIKNSQLHRGRVIISFSKQTRKIEAIWIQSGRRPFVIAAKDIPEDLDQIEAMIPVCVSCIDSVTKIKGVF